MLDAWYPNKKVTTVSLVVTWGLALVFTPIAVAWQKTQQEALNMPQAVPGSLALAVSAILLGAVLVLIGRCIRAVTRLVGSLIGRIGPLRRWVEASRERIRWIRLAVALVFAVLLFAGLNAGFSWLTGVYDTTNSDASGQSASDLGVNSGSETSPLAWETLGREGRYYVSNTMSAASIAEITSRPAEQPVRLYVGMEQADSFDERAAIAVEELDRVDAWSREYLVIFGVTGTGWVDPDAINALEVVTGGDVTTVATQYSAVPSWIGFIIDSQTTINQNKATIDAVVERWKQLPEDQRPTLVLFGESLGSMGTQGAWTADATPEEVTEDIKSIIWIGPPAESTLWKSWQADRTSGPAWDPVIGDGKITRVLGARTCSTERRTGPFRRTVRESCRVFDGSRSSPDSKWEWTSLVAERHRKSATTTAPIWPRLSSSVWRTRSGPPVTPSDFKKRYRISATKPGEP